MAFVCGFVCGRDSGISLVTGCLGFYFVEWLGTMFSNGSKGDFECSNSI